MANRSLKEYAASKGVSPPFSLVTDLYPKLLHSSEGSSGGGEPTRNKLSRIMDTGRVIVPTE